MKQVNVVYSLIVKNDKILMVYNADTSHWSLPGGKVEDKEYLSEALVRETLEETGYDISVRDIIAVNESKLLSSKEHAIFFTFRCDILGGKERISLPKEIGEIRWVPFEEADRKMPYHKKTIKELLQNSSDYINQEEQ